MRALGEEIAEVARLKDASNEGTEADGADHTAISLREREQLAAAIVREVIAQRSVAACCAHQDSSHQAAGLGVWVSAKNALFSR